jgi:hypothetical protein
MKVLTVYLRIYGACLQETFRGLGKNLWTLILPTGLLLLWAPLVSLLVSLVKGLAGFVLGFLVAALASCYLYFLSGVVARTKVSLQELGQSLKAYFWSSVNLLFVVWVIQLISGYILRGMTQGSVLETLLWLALVTLGNAAPEAMYQSGTYGGLATLQKSILFLQDNWIEWALPNLVWLGLLYVAGQIEFPIPGLSAVISGALFHVGMVYRGHLYGLLNASNHRQRMFRYRSGT